MVPECSGPGRARLVRDSQFEVDRAQRLQSAMEAKRRALDEIAACQSAADKEREVGNVPKLKSRLSGYNNVAVYPRPEYRLQAPLQLSRRQRRFAIKLYYTRAQHL
jgi:hypothetical protein